MADRVVDLPEGPLQIVIFGRKGQGKTELAWLLWDSAPGDRLVIDVNNDVLKNHPEDQPKPVDMLTGGSSWPAHLQDDDEDRLSLRYVPDHAVSEKSYREDLDRAVGMAFSHQGTLLWVDEIGEVAPSGQVGPHTRKALHMGRHQALTIITTSPRPRKVDPLVLAQADVVYLFDLPNPDDQKWVADAIGWDRTELHDEIAALGDHCFLRYVAHDHELSVWPALPLAATSRRRTAAAHMEGDPPRPTPPSPPS